MNTDASKVEDINIPQIIERFVNVFHCIFWRLVHYHSQSIIHPFQEWSWSQKKGSILWRCQSPYHHRMYGFPLTCVRHFIRFPHLRRPLVVNFPFWVVWWAGQQIRVSPCLFAAHLTSSEVLSDFQIWCSPGFQMQSRQARSDPSPALILLWLFLHLHLLVFFSTSLQDYGWNWNGWCWTNTKDDSVHHVWNFLLSVCLRVGSWSQCTYIVSWGPHWFYQTTNQEQLCGFWKHVSW